MIDLILFIMFSFGLTNMLVYGHIFDKIRPKARFFHCTMCMGFHAGWLSLLLLSYMPSFQHDFSMLNAFIFGCISSGSSYALNCIFKD